MKNKSIVRSSIVILFSIVCSLGFEANNVQAHSPHDVINALKMSPIYSKDQTVWIILKNTWILKSVDGGYSWKYLSNGLGHKFKLTSLSVSPSFEIDKTLFISSKGDGIFKSTDGGNSWKKNNNGLDNLRIKFVSISPRYRTDKGVYAAGVDGGLFRTSNGGETWYKVIDKKLALTAIGFILKDNNLDVIVGDKKGTLYLSKNQGEFKILSKLNNSGAITSIAIPMDSNFNETHYVGTEKGGGYKTSNGGKTYQKMGNLLSNKHITSIKLIPQVDEKQLNIYATTWQEAIFKYSSKKNEWQKYGNKLTTDRQADSKEYQSPHFMDIGISDGFKIDRTIFVAGFDGLFKSNDGGKNWIQLETMPVNIIKGFSISPPNNDTYSIAVTTYGGGAYLSEDKGITWSVQNLGLKTTRLSDIAFAPTYALDKKIFTASAHYFYVFNDKKNVWDRFWLKDNSWQSKLYRVLVKLGVSHIWLEKNVFKRTNVSRIWPNIIAVSPNFKNDATLYFGSRYRGFFRSIDGGKQFVQIWSDIDDVHRKKITSLEVSPNYQSDGTLFGSIRWEGVLKSEDYGITWQKKNVGLKFLDDTKSVIAPYYVLSISPNYLFDKTAFAGTESGIFKTSNGGSSWEEIKIGASGSSANILYIGISPEYSVDKTIIISTKGKGLFKSKNGGETWTEIAPSLKTENHFLEFIEFSPFYNEDHTIWGASKEAIFKSMDNGNTWNKMVIPIVRYENNRDVIVYDGDWKKKRGNNYSANNISLSENKSDEAILQFVGTGIKYIGTTSENQGIAEIFIDGKIVKKIDQFSYKSKTLVTLFEIKGLPKGPHTIVVKVIKEKNANSKGYNIAIDAFDVMSNN